MPAQTHVNAVFGRAFPVMGVRLLPLRLGHWRLLEILDSPFVYRAPDGIEPASARDLIVAVAICSRSYRDARWLLRHPAALAVLAWWWGVRHARLDLAQECHYFREYFGAWTAYPQRRKVEGEHPSAMPTSVRLAWLVSTRMAIARAWEFPAIEAMEFLAIEDEKSGGRFVSDKDRAVACAESDWLERVAAAQRAGMGPAEAMRAARMN